MHLRLSDTTLPALVGCLSSTKCIRDIEPSKKAKKNRVELGGGDMMPSGRLKAANRNQNGILLLDLARDLPAVATRVEIGCRSV